MHTKFSTYSDAELIQLIWASGDYVNWPDAQKELFFRLNDKTKTWFTQGVRRELDIRDKFKLNS